MALIAYRLACKSPFHLGTGRRGDLADLDLLPRSDTLASAIISVWRHVISEASATDVTRIAADPPFAISSALPTVMVGDAWRTLLFVPAGTFDRVAGLPSDIRKELKRIRFADSDALGALLNGRLPNTAAQCGEALISGNFEGDLWHKQSRLRMQVDRFNDHPIEGMLYEFGSVQLAAQVRLSIAIDFIDESSRGAVEAALALLGDEGIGGDRSSGYGGFEIEEVRENFAQDFADLGDGARLSLSLLCPARDEIEAGLLDAPAEYTIASRGGWTTSPGAAAMRRRPVNMLVEGSIIRDLGRRIYGASPMVLEGGDGAGTAHPVFRPGCAVTIPIKPPGAS
jgi:CRISPR-associated protein Csm4